MNQVRWLRLMSALDLPSEEESYAALVAAYSEQHRHYHTTEHIDQCLRELDSENRARNYPNGGQPWQI